MLRPEWSDDIGPWKPDDSVRSGRWNDDVGNWEPREPLPPFPPILHEERMSMLRRAFDPASRLSVDVVSNELESEVAREDDDEGEAARGWVRAIRQAQREGVFEEDAARWLIRYVAYSRFEGPPDLAYDMLWDQWHDLRVRYGFPPGEAFHEWAEYPAEAREVDARIQARHVERIGEILEAAGESDLATLARGEIGAFERLSDWRLPPELAHKNQRRSAAREHGWSPGGRRKGRHTRCSRRR